jgi:hypothetical protein
MGPPDWSEGFNPRPPPRIVRRRLLVVAVIGAVIVVILLATIPVTVVRAASVAFTPTLTLNGTQWATSDIFPPSSCAKATGNGTPEISLSWSVKSGQRILSFEVTGNSGFYLQPILYWSNNTSMGMFHFYAFCIGYGFAADAAQPQTVQIRGTWNYNYSATAPIL